MDLLINESIREFVFIFIEYRINNFFATRNLYKVIPWLFFLIKNQFLSYTIFYKKTINFVG